MSKDKTCTACGQTIRKLNPHTMDKQKVRVLQDIAKLNLGGNEWVLAKEGDALETVVGGVSVTTYTAYRARAHASRLVWFGLLESQGHRTGAYKVTKNGLDFLAGRLAVPRTIYCRGGVVKEQSPETVRAMDVKKVALDKPYWDDYAKLQKFPEDTRQLSLPLS